MARITGSNVSFAFSDEFPLLQNLDFVLEPGFTGLVGENGSGKSTLLRLIAGELAPDSRQVRREPRDLSVLICQQRIDSVPDNAVGLAGSRGGQAALLRGRLNLVPTELERWATLSPGERKRWQIAGALFEQPAVWLLDEPSNHLDGHGLAWLDRALQLFRGVGVLVTHDRALLDRHSKSTLRLHAGSLAAYAQPYSAARAVWQAEQESARRLLGELRGAERALARRVRGAREMDEQRAARSSTRRRMKGPKDHDAQSITRKNAVEWAGKRSLQGISALEIRLEQAAARERPKFEREHGRALQFAFSAARPAHLLVLDEPVIRAGERVLLRDVRLTVERDARIGIRGPNGAGKSTLLARMLTALRVPRERVLHLPQDLSEADAARCLAQVRALPRDARGRVLELVSALGASPEALLASRSPSPGEARKLVLAFGLAREVEALFLDEPTNHLDLPAIERLEAALAHYPGALIAISHDARFLERTTTRTLLVDQGQAD